MEGIARLSVSGLPLLDGRRIRSAFLTKGFLRSVSAGIGSQKGVLRSLVRNSH